MKRLAVFAGLIIVVLLIGVVAASFLLDANRYKPELESELSQSLGRQVRLGDLKLSLWNGSVAAADLTISDDPAFGSGGFIRAKSLQVGADLNALILSRRLDVTGITIEEPQIELLQSPSGTWNFATLGKTNTPAAKPSTPQNSTAPLALSIRAINIHNGKLVIGATGTKKKPLELDAVDIGVKDFSSTSQFPFSIAAKVAGGGDIKLDGKAGPISASDASATPFEVNLKINGLNLAGSGLNSMAPDVTGLVSLDGSGNSDGATLRVKGHLKGEQMKFAKNGTAAKVPVEIDFEDAHALRKNSGSIQQADAHIGKSNIALTGTYAEHGESIDLNLKVNGSGVAATDLAALLPPLGIVLPNGSSIQSGTLNVKLTAEGPADKLVTAGDLALSNTKLAGFNLGQKMSAIEKLAGAKTSQDMDIQSASMNVRMAPDGISAQNIQFVVADLGNLTGHGTISPSNALNFQMTAAVRAATVTQAVGNLTIPFLVEGSSAEPVFRPDMNALAKTEIKRAETKALGGMLNNLLNKKKPQ